MIAQMDDEDARELGEAIGLSPASTEAAIKVANRMMRNAARKHNRRFSRYLLSTVSAGSLIHG